MSRIGRILPLGAAILIASCADGTGPPYQPYQQLLGSVIGPGVSTEELHPLKHQVSIVSPGELPLLHVAAQSAGEMPTLETYELSFWAKRGELREVEVKYVDADNDVSGTFLHFSVPATALRSMPDGTPFATGDSVLISLSIDRAEFVVEFGPSGLVFNENTPAVLEVWYGGAEDDDEVPEEQLGLWHQRETGELWFPIESNHDMDEKWLRTHVFHFSTYAVSW